MGEVVHYALRDTLFGISGTWNFRGCVDPQCRLLWLDPRPVREDIHLAYSTYYTHLDEKPTGWREPVFGVYRLLLHLTPLSAQRRDSRTMYLNRITPGRLLDVGCGAGHFLALMRQRGWSVFGIDTDAKAVERAKSLYGVSASVGSVEDVACDSGPFDAITLRHVIEHVYDPVAQLRACRSLLSAGGRVILVTPNTQGYGHAQFGRSWRGLEPPRHLCLFNSASLERSAREAGFAHVSVKTTPVNAPSIYLGSRRIAESDNPSSHVLNAMLGTLKFVRKELQLWKGDRSVGEELVLTAMHRPTNLDPPAKSAQP